MKTILLQLDTDPQPSVFDRVVAVDAGVDQIFSHGAVTTENVEPLVHGLMFTRGPDDLRHSAIFVGGSETVSGEALLEKIRETLFPPLTVSVVMDSNGSNTTAAAAVLCAARHFDLTGVSAAVLGGTGPVGGRVAELLTLRGADVTLCSRTFARAEQTANAIRSRLESGSVTPQETPTSEANREVASRAKLVIACGAPRVRFLEESDWSAFDQLQVAIDLNAVEPTGLGGIKVTDKAEERHGVICYGAIGVGGVKMKIHRRAIRRLFESNTAVLETRAIFELGAELE